MFENIQFLSYKIPKPVTPSAVKHELRAPENSDTVIRSTEHYPDVPENMKNADFYIAGGIDIFSRPPMIDFALQNLYHMEAFSVFHCDRNFFTKRKDYASYLLLYTYEGRGLLEYENRTYHLGAGDGFFIDCRLPHLYKTEGALWKHSVFHLNGPLLPSIFKQFLLNNTIVFSQPLTGSYQASLEKLLHIYSSTQPYRDWQASNCISDLLTDLLIASYSTADAYISIPENFRQLIKYMEDHFSSSITLDDLSKSFGMSKYYLSREFKKYTGFSPIDYLIQLKIEHAKYLLHSTTLPANKISHISGIHDMNNFTNLFKKRTGMTPGQYRKTANTSVQLISR